MDGWWLTNSDCHEKHGKTVSVNRTLQNADTICGSWSQPALHSLCFCPKYLKCISAFGEENIRNWIKANSQWGNVSLSNDYPINHFYYCPIKRECSVFRPCITNSDFSEVLSFISVVSSFSSFNMNLFICCQWSVISALA